MVSAQVDVVCSILTGSALVAFMYAASLAMAVSTAGVALPRTSLQPLCFARRYATSKVL